MRVCVLQPDLEGAQHGDPASEPPRDLTPLLPGHHVTHAFLRKATTHAQLRALRRQGFDVFVNLCEAYLDGDLPSIDVIEALERLNLPYTGPTPRLYDPPKPLQKRGATYAGVHTPDSALLHHPDTTPPDLPFPLFVKPAHAGDSLGIDATALCHSPAQLQARIQALAPDFDDILVERYMPGREFSVLVLGHPATPGHGRALAPIEFLTTPDTPFKTRHMKARLHLPERNRPCADPALARALRHAAEAIFRSFDGLGYCRMDFRLTADDQPSFIDANFACSVLYPPGFSGTADYILAHDGLGQHGFLAHIIEDALARHRARQPPYAVAPSRLGGLGLHATRPFAPGEVIFRGEERQQRIATRRHVASTWSPADQETFRRYAYPLSSEVFILWDQDPAAWLPQNHACDPNTGFHGLDVVARRPIAPGEELTLDYASFSDDRMQPFDCTCGAPACRKRITGQPGNSIDARERRLTATAP